MNLSSSASKLIDILELACRFLSRDFYEIQKLNNPLSKRKFLDICKNNVSEAILRKLKIYKQLFDPTYDFIIFPLDGGENFSHGIPIFSVAILVLKNSIAHSCIVNIPISQEVLYAQKDCGCYMKASERLFKLNASKSKSLENSLILVESGVNEKFLKLNYRVFDSIISSATYVAQGKADALILNTEKTEKNTLSLCNLLITESNAKSFSVSNKIVLSNLDASDSIKLFS